MEGHLECVPYVRQYLNRDHESFYGYAGDILPNTQEGKVGIAILTYEGEYHTAVIIDETEDTWILAESNYNGYGQVSEGREIEKLSTAIRGYFDFDLL